MNRFFRERDPNSDFFYFSIPDSWWSRKYEYVWARPFARGVVLDAACGLSHPFKFHLATDINLQVHACDILDMSHEKIIAELKLDLNQSVDTEILKRINFKSCSIDNLQYEPETFDTIFCISVFEHLSEESKSKSLGEFYRTLKSGGNLILTCDYPDVKPLDLIENAKRAGFYIEDYDYSIPKDALHSSLMNLYCFSMILKK